MIKKIRSRKKLYNIKNNSKKKKIKNNNENINCADIFMIALLDSNQEQTL